MNLHVELFQWGWNDDLPIETDRNHYLQSEEFPPLRLGVVDGTGGRFEVTEIGTGFVKMIKRSSVAPDGTCSGNEEVILHKGRHISIINEWDSEDTTHGEEIKISLL